MNWQTIYTRALARNIVQSLKAAGDKARYWKNPVYGWTVVSQVRTFTLDHLI